MTSLNDERRRRGHRSSLLADPERRSSLIAPSYIAQTLRHHRINLYEKYSSSQNFYFTRDVNDLLDGLSTVQTICLKDLSILDRQEQLLRGCYRSRQQVRQKLQQLCQYFKYYNNSPQFFMRPASNILRQYCERKKMLLYRQIMAREAQIKEDSEQYRSTNNHETQNRVLDYLAKAKVKALKAPSGKKTGAKANLRRDNSFQCLQLLKDKLGKIIKTYQKNATGRLLTADFPEIQQLNRITFDFTNSELSLIPQPQIDYPEKDIYGLNIFKETNMKKRKTKKSQILVNVEQPKHKKAPTGKSASKRLEKSMSAQPRHTQREKVQKKFTPVRARPHHRTLSSEGVNMKSPRRLHKYTASNKG